jgi:hypothetical protein
MCTNVSRTLSSRRMAPSSSETGCEQRAAIRLPGAEWPNPRAPTRAFLSVDWSEVRGIARAPSRTMVAVRFASGLVLGVLAVACSGTPAPEITWSTASSSEPGDGTTESPPSRAPGGASTPSESDEDSDSADPQCTSETEPNDAAAGATPFTTCFAGTLATSKDKDFFSVVVPAGVASMLVEHDEPNGKVAYRVSRLSPPSVPTAFTDKSPTMKVEAGATYVFELSASRGSKDGARPYEVHVTFE